MAITRPRWLPRHVQTGSMGKKGDRISRRLRQSVSRGPEEKSFVRLTHADSRLCGHWPLAVPWKLMHGGVELGGGKAAWCPKNGPPRRSPLRLPPNSRKVAFQVTLDFSTTCRAASTGAAFYEPQTSALQTANCLRPNCNKTVQSSPSSRQ